MNNNWYTFKTIICPRLLLCHILTHLNKYDLYTYTCQRRRKKKKGTAFNTNDLFNLSMHLWIAYHPFVSGIVFIMISNLFGKFSRFYRFMVCFIHVFRCWKLEQFQNIHFSYAKQDENQVISLKNMSGYFFNNNNYQKRLFL